MTGKSVTNTYRRDPQQLGMYRPLFDSWDEHGPQPDYITSTSFEFEDEPAIRDDHFRSSWLDRPFISTREFILIGICAVIIAFCSGAVLELSLRRQAIVNQEDTAIYPLSHEMEELSGS